MEIIRSSEFKHLSIKVDAKISSKYLKEFFKTQLSLKNISYTDDSWIYYNYIEQTSTYEVIIGFNKLSKKQIPEFLLPFGYYQKTSTSCDIFIFDTFFTIFKDGKFFALKFVQNETIEDIKLYVTQIYKLKINNIIVVDKDLEEKFLTNFPIKKIKYIKLNSSNSFNFFILYFIICSIGFLYLFVTSPQKNTQISTVVQNNPYEKLQNIYKKHNPNMSENLVEFIKYLKILKIYITKLDYNKNSVSTILFHKNKQKLYDIFTNYKNIKIKSIRYNANTNLYEMDIKIEF